MLWSSVIGHRIFQPCSEDVVRSGFTTRNSHCKISYNLIVLKDISAMLVIEESRVVQECEFDVLTSLGSEHVSIVSIRIEIESI